MNLNKMLLKLKEPILYIIFGVLTTVINIFSYYCCYVIAGIGNIESNIIAWILAVSFAFITNKIFVFESKFVSKKVLVNEAVMFFSCRVATGAFDLIIMFVGVDILNWNAMLMKTASNVFVIIMNYLASKMIIFKK